ncbi:hypothetical protein Q5741_13805 [Paenibacillus sp. JX-17]|uniref:DUF4860 domain-containing protein n=1 Tax=Paenibacillus lacisoli TaxID=3064525 RepID=A0ABT9CII0_9BACL|nr:hypothetical protein [Paenibacillus sp. JX-17]MDO7907481.1 hypothetical protein [Paenibacillus sp. JX-17]
MQPSSTTSKWMGLILCVAAIIGYLVFDHFTSNQDITHLPEANIEIQTQSVNGIQFNLRSAAFTDQELAIGYEVIGGGLEANDLVCRFYNDGKLIEETTGGAVYTIRDHHEYLSAGTSKGLDRLPNRLNLTVEILSRSNASASAHDGAVQFHLMLDKSS